MMNTASAAGIVLAAVLAAAVLADSLPDINSVGIEGIKTWAAARLDQAKKDYDAAGLSRYPSPTFWPGEVVYQIQVDRFLNGNSSNDYFNMKSDQRNNMDGSDLWGIQDWRHGGDLAGIKLRLPYLKDLGVTALWITPILKHDGSYHGYCLTDPTEIDPGFGSNEEFREFVQDCHKEGIKVVLDIVVNHLCDTSSYYSRQPNHAQCAGIMHQKFWDGIDGGADGQGEMSFSGSFFPPLKSPFFFNRCGPNSFSEMAGQGPEAVFGDFTAGMFDFDTRNWDFQEIFTKLMLYWVAYADIDGFRLDAAKHVTEDFTAYLSTMARSYASEVLGKKDFLVVGEVAASSDWIGHRLGNMFTNPQNPDDHGSLPKEATKRIKSIKDIYLRNSKAPYPGLNAVYDFNESGRSRDVFLSKQFPTWVQAYFTSDDYTTMKAQNDPRLSWTLLEIHDWPRFLAQYPWDANRVMSALGYLLTMQGTPVIYYGLEQGFNGNCDFNNIHVGEADNSVRDSCSTENDARKRQDMFMGPYRLKSAVPALDKLAYIGKASVDTSSYNWESDPMLNRDHDIYKFTRELIKVRKSCGVLNWGSTVFSYADNFQDGLIAFSRLDDSSEIVVIVNLRGDRIKLPRLDIDNKINPGSEDGHKYRNLFNWDQVAFVGHEQGQAHLYFPDSNNTIGGRAVMVMVSEKLADPPRPGTWAGTCKSRMTE